MVGRLRRAGIPRRDLLWENLALRQQLAVYQRQTARPRRYWTDATSLRMALSKAWSATSRFSRAFSRSSCLNRFA